MLQNFRKYVTYNILNFILLYESFGVYTVNDNFVFFCSKPGAKILNFFSLKLKIMVQVNLLKNY